MTEPRRIEVSLFDINLRPRPEALIRLVVFTAVLAIAAMVQGQTLTVLHNFTSGGDGGEPFAGVTLDQQGRIYGTTSAGGSQGSGVVYRLVHQGPGWVASPLYTFQGSPDGAGPFSRVVFGPDGLLYGTTTYGGAQGFGTVFSLRPPASVCRSAICPWMETVLYSFTGGADGGAPEYGDLSFDAAGNIYGTANTGGAWGHGVVFKLSRSGGAWTESVIWSFNNLTDGSYPWSGVTFDNAGNAYGTTSQGGPNHYGTIYKLSPTQSGWTETTLYSFNSGDNGGGAGGLVVDAQGDLFGITGISGPGAAYELTPHNGSWSFTLLQSFFGGGYPPTIATPTLDSQGNVYGPVASGGNEGYGEIFKLTPSGNGWIYSSIYDFTNLGPSFPIGTVTFDANGNMYGTTEFGGSGGLGTVWEITP